MTTSRRLVLPVVVLVASTGIFAGLGFASTSPPYLSLNVNQEVIEPGGDASVSVYWSGARPEVRLVRVDPAAFSRDPAEAIASGVVTQTQSVPLPTSSSYYNHSSATFRGIPLGLYVVAAYTGGSLAEWDVLQSTRIGLILVPGADRDLVWVVRTGDGTGVAEAQLLRNGTQVGTSDEDGLAWLSHSTLPVVARSDDGVAIVSRQYNADAQLKRTAIYTDRPLYRPGQTLHVKFVAGERIGEAVRPSVGESLPVQISTYARGREVRIASASVEIGPYGTATMDLPLPSTAPLGHYTIRVDRAGRTAYGSFSVQEYRLPTFRVELAPSMATTAVGEPQDFLVAAKFYYGEPLPQGTVQYTVQGSRYWWRSCMWCSPDYGSTNRDAFRVEGNVDLASDGTARLNVAPDSPGFYEVRVKVTAPTGEVIESAADLTVEPSSVRPSLALDSWSYRPGDTVRVHVGLQDLEGAPRDGDVSVRLYNRTWNLEGLAPSQQWDVHVKDGAQNLSFRVPTGGSYLLEARAVDEKGRTGTARQYLWVWDSVYRSSTGQGLDLVPEKLPFRRGETIRLGVISPFPAPVLVLLQADAPLAAQLIAPGELVQFSPDDNHSPNVVAKALQLRQSQGFLPSLLSDSLDLSIAGPANRLNVSVLSDRDVYSDGEEARILVRVLDDDGRPARAEVTLVMVDEALLDLAGRAEFNLYKTLYPSRYAREAFYSWAYSTGGSGGDFFRAVADSAPGMTTPSALTASPPPSVNVREYFPETALWLPSLETGPDGTLRVRAALPDSLTTWRILAYAVTQDGGAGQDETELVTRRDVVAGLYAPRFLVEGDEASVQATVANYVGALTEFRTLLNATGAEILSAPTRSLTVSHGQLDLVTFRVRATEPGTATFTFYAWSGGLPDQGDAIRIRVPVLVHGIESRDARAGVNDATITLTIPPDAREGPSIGITLEPSVASGLVDALPFLAGYPYGCVEQTLSRFLPTLAVAEAAKVLHLNATKIAPDLGKNVQAGLDRLYGYQHDNGMWGWWTDDPDNPFTTAYVIYGLATARDAGFPVDEGVLARGVSALRKDLPARADQGALYAYMAYALSVADPSTTIPIPAGTSAAELALASLVAHETGRSDAARQKADALAAIAQRSEGTVHWDDATTWGTHGMSSRATTNALALRALLAAAPASPLIPESARWLMLNREGSQWASTKETAEAVFSLAQFFRTQALEGRPFDVTVTVDGQAHRLTVDPRDALNGSAHLVVPAGPGTHTVSIGRNGSSLVYWTAVARFWTGAEPLRAAPGPFAVQSRILDESGRDVSRLVAGEEATFRVTVGLTVEEHRYVQVLAPLPAGVEVVSSNSGGRSWWQRSSCHWCYSWSAAEVHDDHVGFFAWRLKEGATFEVRVRAVFPGDYHVLPASAQEMYDADVRGHGHELRLLIDPAPGLQFGRTEVRASAIRANVHAVGDLPDSLRAWIRTEEGDGPSRTFQRSSAEAWTIDVPLPATGDFTLLVESGPASAQKPIRRTPQALAPIERFNATDEDAWALSPPVVVSARVGLSGLAADYAGLFRNFPAEPVGPVSQRDRTPSGIPALIPLMALAAGLALVGWRMRKRKSD